MENENLNLKTAVSADNFDYTCRTCLCNLKESLMFDINDLLLREPQNALESTETLTISEVLFKCTSLKVNMKPAT